MPNIRFVCMICRILLIVRFVILKLFTKIHSTHAPHASFVCLYKNDFIPVLTVSNSNKFLASLFNVLRICQCQVCACDSSREQPSFVPLIRAYALRSRSRRRRRGFGGLIRFEYFSSGKKFLAPCGSLPFFTDSGTVARVTDIARSAPC